jgi:hypothetical protein
MERGTGDRNMLDRFCTEFCRIVEKHCNYIIVSGFLAISSGRVRSTEDIDMIIPRLSKRDFGRLHDDLNKGGFICMQSGDASVIYEYLADKTNVRYTYMDKPVPEMELKFAKDALDDYQLSTRKKIALTGLDVYFSSIEMNIAFKEEYLKSDKDMEDARHLRLVFSDEINEEEIRRIKSMIRELRL